MKKIFALLLAALSVAFFACGDEKTDNGNDWFLAPAASADGTTVELTCLTRFGDGVLEELGAGFACAELTGIVRGMLPAGLTVEEGMKAGDIDPRCQARHCFTVSDKARAIGGGVLEGLLYFGRRGGAWNG